MKYVKRANRIINKSNGKIYQIIISYKSKQIEIRDMLPLTQCKLSALPKAFGIEGIKKELFLYKYFTLKRLKSNIHDVSGNKIAVGIISEAELEEDLTLTKEDYENITEINLSKHPWNKSRFVSSKHRFNWC